MYLGPCFLSSVGLNVSVPAEMFRGYPPLLLWDDFTRLCKQIVDVCACVSVSYAWYLSILWAYNKGSGYFIVDMGMQ